MPISTKSYKAYREFDNHYQVYPLEDQATGLKGFIAIHRRRLEQPSFGATRIVCYKSEEDALKDSLKLSHLMTYKNAIAGLPYGGAKAALIQPASLSSQDKQKLLKAYAKKVNELKGRFITGADVGIDESDLQIMYQNSPYMVGLKSQPVRFTTLGLFFSLGVALKEIFGSSGVQGRTFAIQGLGKIGSGLLEHIYKDASKMFVADINSQKVKDIVARYPKVTVVDPREIISQKADVFCPCALGGVLNSKSLKHINCPVILGGANNQLECPSIGEKLFKIGILYAPDYVVNGGGVISVTDEYENPEFDNDRLMKKVKKIADTLLNIIEVSKRTRQPTNTVADQITENILNAEYAQQPVAARV